MDNTEKDTYLKRINEVFEQREELQKKREEEYERQKKTLAAMLDSLKEDRSCIEQEREELAAARERLSSREEEIAGKEKMLQDWHKEETEARRQLEEQKQEFAVKMRLELEEARNEKLGFRQLKEELAHKLDLLGILSEQEKGRDLGELFREILNGTEPLDPDIREENEKLHAQVAELKECITQREEEIMRFGEERKKLLGMIAKFHPASSVTESGRPNTSEAEGRKKDDKEEKGGMPEEDAPYKESADEAQEDMTASVLKRYIERNEAGYSGVEIRHSEEGEQLHASRNGLAYVYIFSDPAFFEISAERKDSRSLQKVLKEMNEKWPGVQFRYEDGRAYATGFFSTDISPGRLLERVGRISEECFEQRKAS